MTLKVRPRRAQRRSLIAALLIASLMILAVSASALGSPAHHNRGRTHSRSSHSSAARQLATPRLLLSAARRAAHADRVLVATAKNFKHCRTSHPKRPSRCNFASQLVQRAGTKLANAQRRLARIAAGGTVARVSSARGAAARRAPLLTVSGATLRWTKVDGLKTYIVVRRTPGVADLYTVHRGTSYTPPAIPGAMASYSVRTSVHSSNWARERWISYPRLAGHHGESPAPAPAPAPAPSTPPVEAPAGNGNPQAAPQLTVSGETLSWSAVAHVTTYVLVRKVPGSAPRYSEVTGTSVTPPASPGETVHYSLRTAVQGSSWAPEVAISYPATPVSTPPSGPSTAPAPPETPSTSVGSMWVGVDAGGWPSSFASDIAGAVSSVRLDSATNIAPWSAAGLKVIEDLSGPYNSGGVSAVNANEWAAQAVAWYRANPSAAAIEILNEPGNQYIGWGSSAGSAQNAAAYDHLLKVVHEAFVANFGSAYPALLASYDGGEGPTTWGEEMWAADPNVGSYINGITMHSYGGTSSRAASALGSRYHIEAAHAQHPGIPIYITEIGWPTAVGQSPTGDSLQWTEAEQAANITNFVAWAKSTGYIADVTIFNYRDYGSNDWYGIESASGAHKASYAALAAITH